MTVMTLSEVEREVIGHEERLKMVERTVPDLGTAVQGIRNDVTELKIKWGITAALIGVVSSLVSSIVTAVIITTVMRALFLK